jgi:D-lyxose ketol-isomerase
MLSVVQKKWGTEYWEVNTPLYCCKVLLIIPGWRCSLHRHFVKDETFLVRVGEVVIEAIDPADNIGDMRVYKKGESIRILPGTWHRFSHVRNPDMPNQSPAMIEEISTHHDDADVERMEESGRIPDDWPGWNIAKQLATSHAANLLGVPSL